MEERLKKGIAGLSKLASIFGMPAITVAVPAVDGSTPKLIAELERVATSSNPFVRGIADALREKAIASAIAATQRHTPSRPA